MPATAQLGSVVLDCPEPERLADFYSQLLGWRVVHSEPDWYVLGEAGHGMRLAFQRAPGYRPPTWPDPASSMQFHLDVRVDDLDAAEQRAIELGATRFDQQPDPANFRVMADPVGHPFCVCVS